MMRTSAPLNSPQKEETWRISELDVGSVFHTVKLCSSKVDTEVL